MAAKQSTNLDKSTPESVWKEVLGTQEVRSLRARGHSATPTLLAPSFCTVLAVPTF